MSETKIRAALFDMDGTILDSSVIWNTIARDTLLALNYVPRTDIARETYDLDACDVASYMIETYHMKESFSCVNDMLFSGLLEFYRFHAGLKPGAKAFLEELKQNSVFIALISASPYEFIYPSLKRNGVDRLFDRIISCTEWPGGKQQPDVFLHALSLFGVDARETWLFEDSFSSIRTANALGIHTCGVDDYGATFRRDIVQSETEVFLENWSETAKLPFMPFTRR